MTESAEVTGEATPGLSFAEFRAMFHYAEHPDMQFKFLKHFNDEEGAATIAAILAAVGEAIDTGDVQSLHRVVQRAQAQASHIPRPEVLPQPEDIPFAPLQSSLAHTKVELLSAGGVFVVDDDPMGPNGPSQTEVLPLITEFLRGVPTLSLIPKDTTDERLTARHPGYDARTAQRDPNTVFPLAVLRDLADDGIVGVADTHRSFTGATSYSRLKKEVAPAWAAEYSAREVDAVLLVAT